MADVLLVSDDPDVVDHVLALTSASQLTAEVLPAIDLAAQAWLRSVVVVVGVDRLPALVPLGLPGRPDVVVVGHPDAADWRAAFELGAEAIIEPPGEPGWLAERVRRAGEALPSGRVVGVLGSRGGAGASVFAAALAMAAVRDGHTPYLIDLDPAGCGLAVVLGQDHSSGLTWDSIGAGVGRIPASSLQATVAQVRGVALLGWAEEVGADLAAGVAGAVVDAARLCTPLTVVDLGRVGTAAQQEAVARCDRVLMVVPADVRAVRAAIRLTRQRGLSMCELVVRGPNPGGLVAEDVAEAVGLPVLAAVAAERDLDRRLERGEPPGGRARSPLGRAGTGILRDVLA